MRGRGLLIAAAALQIIGTGVALTRAIQWVARGYGDDALVCGAIAFVLAVIAAGVLTRSLLAWCMSLFVSAVILLVFLVAASPLAREGSSLVGIAIVAAVVVANVGLLVGGRHAVFHE